MVSVKKSPAIDDFTLSKHKPGDLCFLCLILVKKGLKN